MKLEATVRSPFVCHNNNFAQVHSGASFNANVLLTVRDVRVGEHDVV